MASVVISTAAMQPVWPRGSFRAVPSRECAVPPALPLRGSDSEADGSDKTTLLGHMYRGTESFAAVEDCEYSSYRSHLLTMPSGALMGSVRPGDWLNLSRQSPAGWSRGASDTLSSSVLAAFLFIFMLVKFPCVFAANSVILGHSDQLTRPVSCWTRLSTRNASPAVSSRTNMGLHLETA